MNRYTLYDETDNMSIMSNSDFYSIISEKMMIIE